MTVLTRFSALRIIALVGLAALVAMTTILAAAPTSRSEPPAVVAAVPTVAFEAPRCTGPTTNDPATQGTEAYPNLLLISGQRLQSLQAGSVVPLYDSQGYGDESYPPLCAAHYDSASGQVVSEWMFCTDIWSKVCGDVGAGGTLNQGSSPVNTVDPVGPNPKLNADQARLISWLIHNGNSYQGFGPYGWNGVDKASASAGENERLALQTLIWCISDPVEPGRAPSEADRGKTCDASLSSADQSKILAQIPADEKYNLTVSNGGVTVSPGAEARFVLTSNVFGTPISVTTSGTTPLAVCEGESGVTVAGNSVVIDQVQGESERTVVLCTTAGSAGTVSLDASVVPPSSQHLVWNQSRNNGDIHCQVFGGFRASTAETLSAEAVIRIDSTPTTTATTTAVTSTPSTPETTGSTPTETSPTTTGSTPTETSPTTTAPNTEGPTTSGPTTTGPATTMTSTQSQTATAVVVPTRSATAVSGGEKLPNTGFGNPAAVVSAVLLIGLGALLILIRGRGKRTH